ncbi:WXG100 family type VII secretion target [Actinocrispum wychmicini]|uniref:PPE family protein n=1 Tax=Actinocrispum wychmicini TaxID=1213861 RepID=A0A4R2K0A1_9PSEU|nr:PPE domain-containing protein [Actinocrispum wychmicini]TCO65067.1 PPE family protein [Actinocrispum wychmicini]
MPNEADGVYQPDHARSTPTVGEMIATIAAHAGSGPPSAVSGADLRVAPVPAGALYENVDHPTLKAMVTDGVDPDQVGALAEAWRTAGAKLTQFQTDVAGAVDASRGEWQGEAGDLARQFIAGVGRWVGDAGRGAQLAGTQAAKHSEALATARNAMPEPVPFDVDAANAELRSITDPVLWITRYAEHMKAYAEQQAAQRQAAEVVTNYDTALADSSTMPAFAPPPAMSHQSAPVPPMPRVSHEIPMVQVSTSDERADPGVIG